MPIVEAAASPSPSATRTPTARRLLSIDVLRGLCVAGMVLVNFPGDWVLRYSQLAHADWDGATATDMIFPEFLFLAGFSMTLSFASRSRRGESRRSLAGHVILRSLLLLVLGLLLNAFPFFDLHMLHFLGVLQRIALCYLFGGLFTLATADLESPARPNENAGFTVNSWAVAGFMLAVLVGVWALVRFIQMPGYSAWRFDHNGNLGAVIDRALFGNRHLSNWGGPERMWDADGLLSCVTSIPNFLLGVLAAAWMRKGGLLSHTRSEMRLAGRTLTGMAVMAGLLIVAGVLLNPYLVINRKIWTDSFTLLSSGVSLGVFTLFYFWLDAVGVRRWQWALTPALVYGSNAILGFVIFSILFALQPVLSLRGSVGNAHWVPGSIYGRASHLIGAYNASLVHALLFVGLVAVLLWPFYHRRIFLRL
jgi:predicted acyltransferase